MARTIRGTNGNDRINQNGRFELKIFALDGNDTIVLDRDDDLGGGNFVDAGKGNDSVVNSFEGGNQILLGKGNDTYVGTGFSALGGRDGVDGGAGNDKFFVSTQKSLYIGGKGNDEFASEGWENTFKGGDGIDTVSYHFRHESNVIGNQGVTIDLAFGAAQTGTSRRETLISIENAIASENSDTIGGTDGKNVLVGLGGDDEIYGFGGNDMIVGGRGADLLSGGAGRDVFVFQSVADSTPALADLITDFSRAEGDRIDLSMIDAVNGGRDQAFSFIGATAFSGQAGELRLAGSVLSADVNGDGRADFAVQIDDMASMVAADFIL